MEVGRLVNGLGFGGGCCGVVLPHRLGSGGAVRLSRWFVFAAAGLTVAFLIASAMAAHIGFAATPEWGKLAALYLVVIVSVAALRSVRFLFHLRLSLSPTRDLASAIAEHAMPFLLVALGAAMIAFYLAVMGWLKAMLPLAVPFWADGPLGGVDSALFGAAIISIPGIGYPYLIWQLVQIGSVLMILHWSEGIKKDQAIIAFMLTWAIGMVAAFAVSSAGPIFTGSGTWDAGARLEASYLWANYTSGSARIGGGISAFPSMHVAVSVWLALAFRRWWLWLYAFLIALGAISLRWHYFMDVLGGISVAIVAWKAAALVLHVRQPRAVRSRSGPAPR